MIEASSTRRADGWAPTLIYNNGGRVIAALRCGTMQEAIRESEDMLDCMRQYPNTFLNCHPEPHQCIDLSQ